MASKTSKRYIQFEYNDPNNQGPRYVNGARGGFSGPKGELILHFYFERLKLPESVEHELLQGGKVGPEKKKPGTKLVVDRRVQSSVVMDFQTAVEIHAWLGQKINEQAQSLEKHLKDYQAQLEQEKKEDE